MAVTPVELQKADPSWFFSNPQAIASIGDPCILPDGDGYFLYATKGGARLLLLAYAKPAPMDQLV